MKRTILAALIICNCFLASSQTILNPKIAASSVSRTYVQISQIEITEDNTIISFNVHKPETGYTIYIPKETYIVSSEGGEKFFLQNAKGIVINERFPISANDRITFKLYFPKIGKDVKKINYRGGDEIDSWNFFEITINPYIGDAQYILQPEKKLMNKDGQQWFSITNPKYVAKSSSSFNIYRIDLMDTATVLYFEVMINNWSVPAESCIQPSDGGKVLFVKSAEGTIINEKRTNNGSGVAKYKLFFPPIDKNVKKINFKELNRTGDWFVFELDVSRD